LRNIPTDLLRAFITVLDLGSHSRAGERLGRSQPTISLQIKRLQHLLDAPLFDRAAGEHRLTEDGETVAAYARRILALNDDLVQRLARNDAATRLRIGIPDDYAGRFMPLLMSQLTHQQSRVNLEVACDISHRLIDGVRDGLYDVVLAMSRHEATVEAFMSWPEPLDWIGADGQTAHEIATMRPLRIVGYPQGCVYRRSMLESLNRENIEFEVVYASLSFSGIEAAVASGFGLSALARRVVPPGLKSIPTDGTLPELDDVRVGLYVNGQSPEPEAHAVAERIARFFDGQTAST
jgi:DNA-binding transcriptional LysR family regulator